MNVQALIDWFGTRPFVTLRILLLVFAVPAVLVVSRLLQRSLAKRLSPQVAMLLAKGISYSSITILVLMILRDLGVTLAPLLGAAGVVGIAVGFAAQTSLSNLICGVFLILERPFQVGDVVKVDAHMGVVHSIDLLCVRLRTFDNTLIRIPNETMIKSAVTTVTAFPIRRLDVSVGVAYKENIERVMRLLREIADGLPQVLDEPEPFILFKGFGESSLDFTLGVWIVKADVVAVRNQLLPRIKQRFDAEGIEIPFPHRSLYAGEATAPFPIRIIKEAREREV